ncbi:hypothetical protein [Nioella sp. MMSF_3534]|uniref:hypothetical protein n=1 Tax=Nioella sp. MMSF_3534 TaxID=3046720 RepID=UPI0027400657|nr:hypothetical protein [Nioella sp. MMSF_3534]
MQDKTIDNALRALCGRNDAQAALARDLLALRGVEPPLPSRYPKNAARNRETRQLVLDALRDGPKSTGQIGAVILAQKPELTRRAANNRAYQALLRLEGSGSVVRWDGVWLAP